MVLERPERSSVPATPRNINTPILFSVAQIDIWSILVQLHHCVICWWIRTWCFGHPKSIWSNVRISQNLPSPMGLQVSSCYHRLIPVLIGVNSSDALTAFPIDLVIFHLVGPWIFRRIDFNGRMKEANVVWFRLVAKFLRLTSFLFGGRHFEEETDLYTELAGTATDPKNFRFMRVPNHDHIEIKPGVRDIMIPIRQDDPVLGRPNETEEETRSNWVKVFVPTHFRFRVHIFALAAIKV